MTRVILIVAMLTGLAACGVDGSPTAPEPRPANGLSITGTAEIGIVGGN